MSELEQFEDWKGYPLPPLNRDGQFEMEWLHREWLAFRGGLSRRTQPEATKPAQDLGAAIPEGWQLVPKEPTKEILTQMAASCTCDQCLTRRYGWMLDAARLSATPVVNPEVLKEQASVALIQRRKIQDLQKTVIELRSALAATSSQKRPTTIRFALSESQREQIKFAAEVLEVEGFNKEAEELQSIYDSTQKG